MTLGTARVIRGNALALPLEDESVDLIVTSPPFLNLRSYQDGGRHYEGQIGTGTQAQFIRDLLDAMAECKRVLKPTGSIFVELGDSYRGKSLNNSPHRFAIACTDQLGLLERAEIVWDRPNGLPESVTDRVRRSHSVWFHFTKSPRYYSAVDEIREEAQQERPQARRARALAAQHGLTDAHRDALLARGLGDTGRSAAVQSGTGKNTAEVNRLAAEADRALGGYAREFTMTSQALGKLPGSVWRINGGESLVRSVLQAVASGGITTDEGERILTWSTHSNGSWPTSTRQATAGNGPDTDSPADTARHPSSVNGARRTHIDARTNSSSDPSLTGSPLTTSAATEAACDPTTSNQSPFARTSNAPTHPGTPADTDTPWLTPTLTPPPPGSVTGSAAPASSPASDEGGSVWQVPTQPLKVPAELGIDHYAAFALELPRRIIAGWSPPGICTACGQGRRPVTSREASARWPSGEAEVGVSSPRADSSRASTKRMTLGAVSSSYTLTGYACGCPDTTAPTTPALVLDPFGGTGTTALAAKALGRTGISVDMSADYCRLAEWRTTDPRELASAMQVDKPAPVAPDQLDLLEGLLA
jgi:DNA modification methylase